jgi:hypothetical protein
MAVDPPVVDTAAIDHLIERCLQGDQLAWDAIVRQYWRKVFNVAYKFVGETIDRDVDAGDLSPVSAEIGPYASLEQSDRRALLRQALDQLAPTLRSAVLLRDIQELSYQEIAEQLNLPEGTVKSRINRGRLELARQIRKIQESGDVPRQTVEFPRGRPGGRYTGVRE